MQCKSPDALSVAEYYSNELVNFVRKVMEIIPVSVFKILTDIVVIKERKLKPLPVRLEVDLTKDYAQLSERYKLAKLTHQVSIFTEGILAMQKTLLGVIQVDPRAILEDGLRKELVRQIAGAMNDVLVFPSNAAAAQTHDATARAFSTLSKRINGYRLAIEYIQDYVDIAGLKMWQAELTRILSYNAEQETNKYLQKKIFDSQSRFQSRAIPIPSFKPIAEEPGSNFVGRTGEKRESGGVTKWCRNCGNKYKEPSMHAAHILCILVSSRSSDSTTQH